MKFKRNFWIAFLIVIIGFFICLIVSVSIIILNHGDGDSSWIILLPFVICLIPWIIGCVKKMDKKNAWITGGAVGFAIVLLIGVCAALIGMSHP